MPDEELEDIIKGIPKTRRGQKRRMPFDDATFNEHDEEDNEEYYD